MSQMLRRIRVTRGSAPATWPPVWVLIVASSFCAYFVLLLYCEIVRPENAGFSCAPGTLMVSTVLPGSPADRAGVRRGDRLVALNGLGMESADSWAAVGANFQMGVPMPIVVERDGRAIVLQLRLERMPPAYWRTQPGAFLLIVRSALFLTLLAGLLIAWRRPRDPIALTAAWLLLTCAVFTIAMPLRIVTVWRELPVPLSLLLWIPYASSLNFAAVLLTFVAGFPRRLPYAARVQTVTWIVAAVVSAPPLANFAALITGADVLRPVGPATTPLLAASVVWLAAVVVIMIVNYGRITDLNERRRLRAVLAGIATAALPGFSLIASFWIERKPNLAASIFESQALLLAAVALLAAPLSITYAVLRHRLFDISVIARQWLQYALARWAVLSVAPVLMATIVVDLLAHGHETVNSVLRRHGGLYLTVTLAACVAYVLRTRWLDALDRRFFRERHRGYALLREVAEQIRRAAGLEQVAPLVVARIETALHPEFAALLVRAPQGAAYQTVAAAPVADAPDDLPADSKVVAVLRVFERPLDSSADGDPLVLETLHRDDVTYLRRSRIDLLVPVVSADHQLEAILALGPKRSEEPYGREDHDLLVTVAGNLALLMARSAPIPPALSLEECEACGACYDEGTRICEHDRRALQPLDLPRTLANRYRLLQRIGGGGMGTVYEAHDVALDKRVAVKIARDDLPPALDAPGRLPDEARRAAMLVHPNVITMLDRGIVGRRPFLVMERLYGRTLRQELEQRDESQADFVLGIIQPIASAIDAAHALGLVHRDLKPDNIYLAVQGRETIPKVLDFGLARPVSVVTDGSAALGTGPGFVTGTLEYMAPERLRGAAAHAQWDLWSLSVIAYEMLTGRRPGPASLDYWDPGELMRATRPHCAAFFRRALALDPAARPPDARSLAADLQAALRADESAVPLTERYHVVRAVRR